MPAVKGQRYLGRMGANADVPIRRTQDSMNNLVSSSAPDSTYGWGPSGRTEGARTRTSDTENTRLAVRQQNMRWDAVDSTEKQVADYNSKHTTPHSSPDPHTPNYKVGGTPMKLMKKKVK